MKSPIKSPDESNFTPNFTPNLPSKSPLKRLFIANRGEIARRIAITAQRLGIETVALTDRVTPPAYLADVVTHLHQVAEETTGLYLNCAEMIRIAKARGCDAIHPGFGFLSENAEFAEAVTRAGLIWVGPSAPAIYAMASKAAARTLAIKAQVPCIEGLDGIDVLDPDKNHDPETAANALRKFARATGFPLLIKAAFGGGGKGMRIVHDEVALVEQSHRAASEAKNSFGNGLLVVERYLESPRHVEVQILADKSGQVFAIGDRDCSLQRRHQKIIEEAPAPGLHPSTRKAMHAAAIGLAKSVGYDSAGTVEFLVDGKAPDTAPQAFYFLEMNTRLQVEHPVSEEVFGLDLVEWQLRIACGDSMPKNFGDLEARGHSVEARIYAEDVHQNFFPAPGLVSAFVTPGGPGIRWEIGLDLVDVVTTKFDPMVAKLVATAATREAALGRLAQALKSMFLANPANNVAMLTWLAGVSEFRKKAVNTHFIADRMPEFLDWEKSERSQLEAAAAAALDAVVHAGNGNSNSIFNGATNSGLVPLADQLARSAFGCRPSAPTPALQIAAAVRLHSEKITDQTATTTTRSGLGSVEMPDGDQGRQVPFHFAVRRTGGDKFMFVNLMGHNFFREQSRAGLSSMTNAADSKSAARLANARQVSAPVPGKIVAIKASPGLEVEAGTPLLVIESMKMEFEVKSQRQGRVESIDVAVGEQVSAGQTVVRWSE